MQFNFNSTKRKTFVVVLKVLFQNLWEICRYFKKIRVACYFRVSTDDPSQEDSYEAQEKYFSKLLFSRPDWESMGVYSDHGISGTG